MAALTAQATTDLERASSAGDMQGVADALALFERVEDAARRQGHPEHLTSVINLANALIAQAEAGASDEALGRALKLLDLHEQAFMDSPLRLACLARKGKALLMEAQRTASRPVMRRAVQVQKDRAKQAPRGHPERGVSMFDLGVTLLHSGSMFGDVADLSEAVAVLESVKKRPDSSVERAAVLSALGNARLERFLRVTRRDLAELDAALEEHQEAISALRPEDPNVLTYLSDFGAALMRAHEQTGNADRSTHRSKPSAAPLGRPRKGTSGKPNG